MTSPIVQLPHASLGNTATDIGTAAGGLVSGIVGARQRAQQIAIQQALANAQLERANVSEDLLKNTLMRQNREWTGKVSAAQAYTQRYSKEPVMQPFIGHEDNDPDAVIHAGQLLDSQSQKTDIAYDPQGNALVLRPGTEGSGPSTQAVAGAGRPLTMQERQQAGLSLAAASADKDLTSIETHNRHALLEVSRALSMPSFGKIVPFVGNGVEDALAQFRMLGASGDAQAYMKRLFDFGTAIGPTRYGRNFRNTLLLHQLWADFGSGQFGITPEGMAASQKNRRNAVLQTRTAAGSRAFDEGERVFDQQSPRSPQDFEQWDH